MGFFDNLRDRLSGNNDDYYDDDYYDDDYDEPEDEDEDDRGNGVLGNTSRPEAESVSVYTRSGRPVSNNAGGPTGYEGQNLDGAGYAPSYRREDGARPSSSGARQGYGTAASGSKARMNASGKLPPYVLHCSAYSDVQTVVRRVRTNQPVVLVLGEIDPSVATRILDFSYGLAFGINGQVQQLAGRTFAVLPEGLEISDAEVEKLRSDGDVED